MIDRASATQVALELAGDAPVIGGVGNATFDMTIVDRPQNFYMWNSMGMAASIGLGVALARPDLRVVILDGDGSVLYNLSSFATARLAGARNLVHVIWDNGGWEITGAQPAGSAFGVDLAAVAAACGIARTARVDDLATFRACFAEALADDQPWVIVADVMPGDSNHRPSKQLIQLRDRFRAALARPNNP
jgi:thiamine pyrophosphate-dependent acetolactate synthase large subunit-like protein